MLDRILETPTLAQVVPHLKPELLHRVIQRCGLEDCAELVALATPAQLARIFDLDLWRTAQSGRDEQFDAARFGVWIEVLVDLGATVAARKLAEMDVDLVTAGLAQHARVFDRATVSSYVMTDGQVVPARTFDDVPTCDVGGYVLVARRGDAWDAIVAALSALDAEQPEYFHQVMRGCRAVSNSMPERDGLDDLLAGADQIMFDLASGRRQRRGAQGYLSRAEAQAFLQMSRQLRLGDDTLPPPNPVARGYFRAIDETRSAEAGEPSGPAPESDAPSASEASAEAVAALADVVEILQGAGIVAPQPRALLGGSQSQAPRLGRIQAHLQDLLEHDRATYEKRNEELAFLSNTIVAGCSIQARAFTPQEASDAAVAICNLGLENWPSTWCPASTGPSASPDLLIVFQVGWKTLYDQVAMYAAERLIGVLADLQCRDRDIQAGLVVLRMEMTKQWRAGAPWRARDALDVLTSLDMLAWATLLGLIDECPVIHAALGAAISSGSTGSTGSTASSGRSGVRAVSATDFEFISENSQIVSVHEFMQSLPGILM